MRTMEKICLLIIILVTTGGFTFAQDDFFDITALHLVATGGTDRENALKQYLLMPPDIVENNRKLIDQYVTFQKEYTQMEINTKIPQLQSEFGETIAKLEKEHPELAASMKENLENAKKELAAQSNMTNPSLTSYSCDPVKLLKDLTNIATNRKPYTGYCDIGNGLYAVTEAPRFGPVQDDVFNKPKMADEDASSWGVINLQGETVIPQKYILLLSSYFIRPNHDLIVFRERGKDGKEHDGVFGYDGRIRVPFIYDNISIIDISDKIIVGTKDGKYGSTDLDGNILWPFEYVKMSLCGIAWPVSKDGKNFGAVSKQGKEVIPFKYKAYWSAKQNELKMERFDGKLDVYSDDFRLLRTENAPHD